MESTRRIPITDVFDQKLQEAAGELRNEGGNPKRLNMAVQKALEQDKPVILEIDETSGDVHRLLIDGKQF